MTERNELPPDPGPRIMDGPWGVLAALASGDPEELERARAAQREQFKEHFGCYPEEAVQVCPECADEHCPIWRGMLPLLNDPDDVVAMAARERLGPEHVVAEIPCRTCGGQLCTIFFCYADDDRGGAKP